MLAASKAKPVETGAVLLKVGFGFPAPVVAVVVVVAVATVPNWNGASVVTGDDVIKSRVSMVLKS